MCVSAQKKRGVFDSGITKIATDSQLSGENRLSHPPASSPIKKQRVEDF
ncbi:hypothetical protein EBL_c36780 [Shimwellia blattae DSM 4481 = NBRC 105725]|uniref:Uncharacterized protein n=1 Tax=Shimwellia blattae (strain ATCC 29907 / DSM 4481 / JCM 1650 / NBRC 105725 / CDC 9005-74) TaxID=630626 RepID=I2BDX5_SHIBC|nr:hypothetical protein EBL_c36780 [Shimwellia blattae DSM 4481 = NBRC 105725]